MKKLLKNPTPLLLIFALIGVADSIYLTYEHYAAGPVICPVFSIIDCGKVIRGKYSEIFGIPLSLFGVFYYTSVLGALLLLNKLKKNLLLKYYLLMATTFGFLFSLYLVYLQLFVIVAICIYCMLSALTSTLLFFFTVNHFEEERKRLVVLLGGWFYRNIVKKIFFAIDPETVHENMLNFGELSGNSKFIKWFTGFLLQYDNKILRQKIAGLNFDRPVGMAAGFDYEAKLIQFLPKLGFGYMSVGTITNIPYEGNPKPRLGRLPESRSLLVNKGFKNEGAEVIATKLAGYNYEYLQGISIGRSNSESLNTQKKSVEDIVTAFKTVEKYKVKNAYYELNISCPNLIHGSVDFYKPKNLGDLLSAVDKLRLKKPVFIKMPIDKTDRETMAMLNVIVKHRVAGVIFGNLQKDWKHPTLKQDEVKKFKMGYFSGKPTFERSNQLIKMSYKKYGKKLVIIGTGGIFTPEDAYIKIKLGASVVQLITGLIYQGPQVVAEINIGLVDLLKRDGYKHISEAVGADVK